MTNATLEHSETVEVYWRPGCSSCLRLKEFMEKSGVQYEEINLIAHPERSEKIDRLGVKSPCVVVGEEFVPGLDLAGIAKLINIDYEPPKILPPGELRDRYQVIAAALTSITGQIPADQLDYAFSERPDRNMRGLVVHAGVVMRKFLESYDTNELDDETTGPLDLCEHGSTAELVEYTQTTQEMFEDWWKRYGHDDPFEQVLETIWGHRTLLEAFERGVWHTAHHTRQLIHFVETLGITPDAPLSKETLEGLPIPDRVVA